LAGGRLAIISVVAFLRRVVVAVMTRGCVWRRRRATLKRRGTKGTAKLGVVTHDAGNLVSLMGENR
jgi:hypothetical protein